MTDRSKAIAAAAAATFPDHQSASWARDILERDHPGVEGFTREKHGTFYIDIRDYGPPCDGLAPDLQEVTDFAQLAGLDSCVYCDHATTHELERACPTQDEDGWAARAQEHAPDCEWVRTRAHSIDEGAQVTTYIRHAGMVFRLAPSVTGKVHLSTSTNGGRFLGYFQDAAAARDYVLATF